MNFFEKILLTLKSTMETPKPFGWFHLLTLIIMFSAIVALCFMKKYHSEKQLKIVLGVYGITAFILEVVKQIVWSFNYDAALNIVTWDYQWYAAPFQLCTTPIYVSLAILFMKKSKIRDMLSSYLAFTTILGSIATIFIPDSCFVDTILVNIHTTWLHYGSFVVSIYLIITGEIRTSLKDLIHAIVVFIVFVVLAEILNIAVYQSGVLNGETFNMFYISPYFISELPVFNIIQQNTPYMIYLLTYVMALSLGSSIVWSFTNGIKKISNCQIFQRNQCLHNP